MSENGKASRVSPQRVGIREFRGNFSGFMREVRDGSSFLVTSRDEVIAVVQPPSPQRPRRRPGTLREKIRLVSDFDDWPDGLIATMEDEGN